MRQLMIAAALLACACTPPASKSGTAPAAADAAGNRMERLSENAGRWCSSDGVWCVAVASGVAAITHRDTPLANLTVGDAEVWPQIIRIGPDGESAIVGLISTRQQMYSGGAGSASEVTLFEVAPGREAQQVLGFPLSGDIMIRSCFDEDDVAARREACHDEYDFAGTLTLDPSVAEGPPRLILTTVATTFPGQISRNADSTERGPLQDGDLVRWRDDTCSFRRVATKEGDTYVWDAVMPPCTDYLEP